MTAGKKPHKECDFFCLFLIEINKLRFCFVFFFREALSMYTLFLGWQKRATVWWRVWAGSGSFPVGAGAGYIQVSLEQSFP